MKKLIALILCLTFTFTFVSCNANDYKLAKKLYQDGDYSQALLLFESLDGYQDSDEKIVICKYYLSKMAMENLDYAKAIELLEGLNYKDSDSLLLICYKEVNDDNIFLRDLESLILNRLNVNSSTTEEELALLDSEIEIMSKYTDSTFYQEEFYDVVAKINEGLSLQRIAADELGLTSYQEHLYQGKYLFSEAMCILYENYDFLKLNEDFNNKFIKSKDNYKDLAEAVVIINQNILDQLTDIQVSTGTAWSRKGNQLFLTIKNTTEYKYTINVTLHYADSNGSFYSSSVASCKKIKPKQTYTLNTLIVTPSKMDYFTWEYMISDVYKLSSN